jgi:hypothetical protein
VASASWGLAFGCSFPDYVADGVLPAETGADAVIDTAPEAPVDTGPYILTDGRVCTGHDEDGDGVPDECDNCPNIANPGLAGKDIGDACNATSLGFTTRLAFDPFTAFSTSKWAYFGQTTGAFVLAADNDSVTGGNTTILGATDTDLRFIAGPVGASPDASGVAVTSVVTIKEEGAATASAGLVARVAGTTGKQFFLCGVNSNGVFVLARTDPAKPCTGGACSALAFTIGEGGTSQAAFPSDVPHGIGQPIGIRMVVAASAGGDAGTTGGDVECRVFNPSAATAASTLQSGDPKYSIKVTVPPSRWIGAGDVGVYALASKIQIHSMDILKGP